MGSVEIFPHRAKYEPQYDLVVKPGDELVKVRGVEVVITPTEIERFEWMI